MKRKACCLLLTVVIFKSSNGQDDRQYIDSINQYIKQIDSIIMEWSVNPVSAISITKSISHFSSLQKEGICASAALYKNSKEENLYRLSYSNQCDSMSTLQDYYFYKTKIVFIRTASLSVPGKNIDQYYLNDEIVNPNINKLYLNDGYEVLKKLSN